MSHLGSGSPETQASPNSHKRVKHFKEESSPRTIELYGALEQDIINLLREDKVLRAYAVIYRDVEVLCSSRHIEQSRLAKVLYQELDTWLLSEVSPKIKGLLKEITPESCGKLSELLINNIGEWKNKLALLLQLFMYLDQAYLKGHPKKARIVEYGLQGMMRRLNPDSSEDSRGSEKSVYYLIKLLLSRVRTRGVSAAYEKVAQELISCIDSIGAAERPDLECTIECGFMEDYKVFQKEWMTNKSTYVLSFLGQLGDDVAFFSSAGIRRPFTEHLIFQVKWKYLLSDMERYVKPSYPVLLELPNKQFLKTLINFCEDSMKDYGVVCSGALLKYWREYIQLKVHEVVASEELIADLVRLWRELENFCKNTFKDEKYDFELRTTVRNCLAEKEASAHAVLLLLKFCDNFMKIGSSSEEDYLKFEGDVLVVFNLLARKEEFTTLYEKALSKRMLLFRHFNLSTEKRLVESFILVIGESDENSNLRAMFRDYETSKNALKHLIKSDTTEFNALVLEKKFWPFFPPFGSELKVPTTLQLKLELFELQYKQLNSKNKYHILDWKNYALHQICLQVNFDSGVKQLYVNLLQAAVLVLFENVQQLSFGCIVEQTNLDTKLLRRVLSSLATKRFPILIIQEDNITFNNTFSDKLQKIRLPLGKDKDISKVDSTGSLSIKSRSSEIRTAIVRIMKDKKTILHPELLGKVIEELSSRGVPQIQDIKVQLENLISNEFIERDEDGITLHYVP